MHAALRHACLRLSGLVIAGFCGLQNGPVRISHVLKVHRQRVWPQTWPSVAVKTSWSKRTVMQEVFLIVFDQVAKWDDLQTLRQRVAVEVRR